MTDGIKYLILAPATFLAGLAKPLDHQLVGRRCGRIRSGVNGLGISPVSMRFGRTIGSRPRVLRVFG
ncbi:MAG: hypothetical protein J0L78_10230 [Planctomycetes bacterium]|nr:hypothetical protein [Planctomycetota bacterium]